MKISGKNSPENGDSMHMKVIYPNILCWQLRTEDVSNTAVAAAYIRYDFEKDVLMG